jgi:beta-1,2-mannobiose phosphorylase / 1,2-beta-oligomannan phosphorylase
MKSLKLILITVFCFGLVQLCLAQVEWEKHPDNPVFTDTTGGFEDAYAPSILIIDNTYHMWYVRFDGTYERIGYATSLDGILWEPYVNNPVLNVGDANSYEETSVTEHCVIYDGSTFHMWYSGINNTVSPWREAIGYATSPDGINWTKYSDQPVLDKGPSGSWDDTKVFCP